MKAENNKGIQVIHEEKLIKVIKDLRSYIKRQHKAPIISLYDYVNAEINLECVSDTLFDEYNELVDKGNDIIYQ